MALDSVVGGIGGIYLDEDGALVVSVTSPERGEAAVNALRRRFPAASEIWLTESGATRSVRVAFARSRFADVVAAQSWAEARIAQVVGVVSSDADERANIVRVGVRDEAARQRVLSALRASQVFGVQIEVFVRGAPQLSGNLKDKWRPTRGGIQIYLPHWPETCSLGLNVTGSDGVRYLLTASHCSHSYIGSVGMAVHQNNGSSGNRVGEVALNPSWNLSDPACGTSVRCRNSDAMLVRYDQGISAPAKIAKTSSAGGTSAGSINVTGWWDAVWPFEVPVVVGQTVGKMGRTTGWTEGPVVATCVNLLNIAPDDIGVLCANEVAALADLGDSGGPAFRFQAPLVSTSRVALGIVFARLADGVNSLFWYSPLSQIILDVGPITF
ncbi:MAG: trypsin-like serine protease [Planctomycetes bacterium]|nr:trypsin-like serine protease [Planctomycetota bacterium]